MNKPRKKRHQQGSYLCKQASRTSVRYTYFRKLPPIEKVAGIVFENENIVDLGLMPNTAC